MENNRGKAACEYVYNLYYTHAINEDIIRGAYNLSVFEYKTLMQGAYGYLDIKTIDKILNEEHPMRKFMQIDKDVKEYENLLRFITNKLVETQKELNILRRDFLSNSVAE